MKDGRSGASAATSPPRRRNETVVRAVADSTVGKARPARPPTSQATGSAKRTARPAREPPLPREEGEGDGGKEVLGRQAEVGDAVVERPEARVDEVRLRRSPATGRGEPRPRARGGSAPHASALQRKKAPAGGDSRPGQPERHAAPAPAVDHADADPDGVERPRRRHEADAVGEAARPRGQLGPVRVTVEDREEADDHRRERKRRAPLGEDGEAEEDSGERDRRPRLPAGASRRGRASRRRPSPSGT